MNFEAGFAYAERHTLHALLIEVDGAVVFEQYANGYDAAKPHALYSGAKSFWGVTAGAAHDDGLLDLDEKVAQTIPEWAADARRARVTLRELLALTSGIGFGGLGAAVPLYERALETPVKDEPGERFTYSGIPLQVFGAVLARKLTPRKLTPHEYLRERLLDPIGVHIGSWRSLKDGTQPLPTGAFLTAREWCKYGRLILAGGSHNGKPLVSEASLAPCFTGSTANPRYGLGWWLVPIPAPAGIVHASGSGGQAMYVIPSERAVVVKFGQSNSYNHATFLKRLLG
jgi:CubicO group peptidase (beta-lactamase class C family)